jgi:hypothetical protein
MENLSAQAAKIGFAERDSETSSGKKAKLEEEYENLRLVKSAPIDPFLF